MDIKQFYDVNKRTQTEQVLKNQEDIDALKDKDTDIDQAIEDEANARVQADEGLAYDIADLQHQIDSFGNVFTLKGSVATYGDLPATDNHIGDVWYVEADAVGYVWIDDNGTERWEQLGLPIDLSDYITTSDLALALEDYQEKLTAGTNITIIDNVISASGGTPANMMTTDTAQDITALKTFYIQNNVNADVQIGHNGNGSYPFLIKGNANAIFTIANANNSGRRFNLDLSDAFSDNTRPTIKIPKANGTLALTSDIKKYYMHIIHNTPANSKFIIISTNSEQMTYSDVAQWLNTKGFTSASLTYTNGFLEISVGTDGKLTQNIGYYSSDGTTIKFSQQVQTPSVDLQTGNISYTAGASQQTYSNINFGDVVIKL